MLIMAAAAGMHGRQQILPERIYCLFSTGEVH